MNQFERDVRDMFRAHERDLDGAVYAPPRLVHRVRRRQIRNTSVGVVTAIALVAVASAATVRLAHDERPAEPNPTSRVAPSLGAANVGGFTFTVPNGWFLSSYSDHAKGPVVGLSNFAPALTNADPCTGMPDDGALLVVDPAVGNGGHAPAWPVKLQPTTEGNLSCGSTQLEARWSSGPYPSSALASFGATASAKDRQTLVDAFSRLAYDGKRGVALGGFGYCFSNDFDAYEVIASGVLAGRLWTLGVDPTCAAGDGPTINLETSFGGNGGGPGYDGLQAPEAINVAEIVDLGDTYLLGTVPEDVARVGVSAEVGTETDATLYDSGFDVGGARVFLAPLNGVRSGTLTTYDAAGSVLRNLRFSPGMDCSDPHQCGDPVRPGQVVAASLSDRRNAWDLQASDGDIALLNGDGHVVTSVTDTREPLDSTTVRISGSTDLTFGVATPETSVVLVYPADMGEPWAAQTALLSDGRVVFWIEPSHGDEGAVASFDGSCTLLGIMDPTGTPTVGDVPPNHGCEDIRGIW
jgi:hypothetical protein